MGAGLNGDIIFSQSIAQYFIQNGNRVIWPVASHYVDACQRAYPDIIFVSDQLFRPEIFDTKEKIHTGGVVISPIRWSDSYMKVAYKSVMRAKYDMYELDWKIWRNHAMWNRDTEREQMLFKILGINAGEKFNLINKRFGANAQMQVQINVANEYRNIELIEIPDFSLFDWSALIIAAAEIYTVSTSILFMMDILPITNPIHLYCRKPIERDFSFVDYIFTKPYILHE